MSKISVPYYILRIGRQLSLFLQEVTSRSRILSLETVDTVGFVVLSHQEVILSQDFRTEGTVEVPAVILSAVSVDASSFRDWFVTELTGRASDWSIGSVWIPSSVSESAKSRRNWHWNLFYNDVLQAHHVIWNRC